MCGIGGILRVWTPDQRDLALRTPHAQSIPEEWLDILDDAVKHRGPDGQGRFRDRAIRADGCVVDVAFVHRRLSIIDHAGGHQPMVLQVPKGALSAGSGDSRPIPGRLLSPEDVQSHTRRVLAESHAAPGAADPEGALGALSDHDRIAVVFNGCIYNHRELRAELQRAGHVFSSDHSDTEVLVHGWREWNTELWPRLRGMFAIVVWDRLAGNLVMARDAFGEKPLYYEGGNERPGNFSVAFGSTSAAVLRLRAFRWPQMGMLARREEQWLRFGFDRRPPVQSSQALEPCAWIRLGGEVDPQACYYRYPVDTNQPSVWNRTTPLSPQRAENLLLASVDSRLESDVPLGCFLSGGIDSSLVAAIAQKKLGRLNTFTVRMPDPALDESPVANLVAKHLGTIHTELDCNPKPADDMQILIHQVGLPFGDSSLLPSNWVSRVASQHVKVAIGGDGGDELFVGYQRYTAADWLAGRARGLLSLSRFVAPFTLRGVKHRDKIRRLAEAASGDGYLDLISVFPLSLMKQLVHEGTGGDPLSAPVNGRADAIRWDLFHYLPDDILRKSDSATMSNALELRSPMLDPELARACLGAPLGDLCPRGQRKGLLRQVARKYLPAEIVDRPKMGFAIPIGEWFRSDYGGLRTMLLDHLNSAEPFGPPSLGIDLNMAFIRRMLDEHLGTGPSGLVKRDHSQRLYMLLVLSIWAKWLGSLR
ncbi:MAG TPA: asparagine synthase (glutamine-hydrolyzing) [Phycisphaerales bacterium]|nr:asparagine synthase (glutamine-hydrolyzing) [Phycisphaerales bacterium]